MSVDVTIDIRAGDFGEPVTFLRLMRAHLGLGLVEAKARLDELAERKCVTLTFPTATEATAFADAVARLGAHTEVIACAAPPAGRPGS